MSKLAIATALLILLACGSGETTQPAATITGDTPPVSAPSSSDADAIGEAVDEAVADIAIEDAAEIAIETAAVDAATSPSDCLELVAAADFAGALPVCAEALAIDPENVEIQAALAEAQAQSAP